MHPALQNRLRQLLDPRQPLSPGCWLAFAASAVGCFHLAYGLGWGAWIVGFPFLLLPLVRFRGPRCTIYGGLALGLGLYAPQLGFFWSIFGPAAIALWLVLAFWVALFLGLGSAVWRHFPPLLGALLLPFLWTGLEYFRSELYYLRFAWLTPGLALPRDSAMGLLPMLGVYGFGFALFLAASIAWFTRGMPRWLGVVLVAGVLFANQYPRRTTTEGRPVHVAGAQTESVGEAELTRVLDQVLQRYPQSELLLLPEYSLQGPPDESLRGWCRRHARYLVVGGREPLGENRFHNTAFVIDPAGEIVFRQVKSVPIQFFADGEPATDQRLWASPWGPLGIAICYDLSYTRVIDRLVRLGAVGLIIPTMDAWSWGPHQHSLHARIAPARAAEYGIPILRCASSGISQLVDASGHVLTAADMDEELRLFGGTVHFRDAGSRPLDRWLAPLAVAISALVALAIPFLARRSLPRPNPTHS